MTSLAQLLVTLTTVGFFARLRRKRPAPAQPASVETFSWLPGRQPWLPGGTYVGVNGYAGRVSRDDAVSVPAVKRGRDLICAAGALPLLMLNPDTQQVPSPLLKQIDPNTSNVVTLAQTFDDLIFEGVSWWEITAYDWGGFPVEARHLDVNTVSIYPPEGFPVQTLPSGIYPAGVVWVMGQQVDARNIIRFDSPNDPLTGPAGARAIRRALKLAQTSEMYADDPEAKAYWTPKGEVDPGDKETIVGHLRDYATARRNGAEAYIPASLERSLPSAPTAVDIQLAQLQQRSDIEIANILGIDPEDIAVNTTSRTYNNAIDRRVDRLNMVLSPYMSAITGRLSLNDVTRRGYRVEFNLDAYMKADPATRWSTYAVAIDHGVMSVGEVREREDLPSVSAPQGVQTNGAKMVNAINLSADVDTCTVSFASEGFSVNKERRIVAGTVIPFNRPTDDARRLRFAAGSVTWNRSAVSHVKLDREHDAAQLLGSATEIKASDSAIFGKFKIARTPAGDEALALAEDGALDGMSAVVEILASTPDPEDDAGVIVTSARLRRVTLTADPAFTDARVTTVAATAVRSEGSTMPDEGTNTDVTEFTAAVNAFSEAVRTLAEARIPAEQRASVTAVASVREPLVYSLNGLGESFVRDAWHARHARYGSKEAEDAFARLRKYGEQTAQLAAQASSRMISLANAGNTTDQADIIPPGYRPDLYVGQVPQGRPLFDSIGTRVNLANATPFKVPYWVGSASLSGTNTEGTGPSTGTITDHDYRTVTPTAQSGEFVVTRELMDSANPAIDVIALNAMREEYAQDTEALIATHIAGYTDDGSPTQLASSVSTEGCYVYAVTGTGNDLYIDGIRYMEGEFPGHRFLTPDRMLAGPTGYAALVRAIDDVGRPMFPFLAPANAGGTVGRAAATLNIDGLAVPNAWSMTSTYDDVLMFNSTDVLVGESPLLTFRFEEKGGPENIYLNIWGYFGVQILRPAGIHACNYTAG